MTSPRPAAAVAFVLGITLTAALTLGGPPSAFAAGPDAHGVSASPDGPRSTLPRDAMREVVPNLLAMDVPELPPERLARMRAVQSSRSASFADWLPGDQGLLVSTAFGESAQIHRVQSPGGAREQLTFADEPIRGALVATFGGREGFFFTRDVGGGEGYQLFFFDLGRRETRRLTPGKGRWLGLTLSADRKALWVSGTARTDVHYDLYRLDLTDGDAVPQLALEREGYWVVYDAAADGRVLLRNYVSSTMSTVHEFDPRSGGVTELLPADAGVERVAQGPLAYDGSGRFVFVVSDRFGEHRELVQLELATGKTTRLTADTPWSVESLDVDPTGRWLAFSMNEGGRSRVHLRELGRTGASKARTATPTLPDGVLRGMAFRGDGKRLAVTLDHAQGPADVFAFEPGKGRAAERWTASEVAGFDTRRAVTPRLVDFPSFDDDPATGAKRRIPAFYFQAPEASREAPAPVLVVIHGGPESQYRPRFSATFQTWIADLGVAVVAPNVRGSAGYGKSYLRLDDGMKREDSVKDIGALLDWVAEQPELDATRVAVLGGSYGGYMVLASLVHFADRLVAGVDVVGISNFVTFLEATKAYRRDLRRVEYGDERIPEMRAFLERISPTNRVDAIVDPLLVAQGLNDPRVPVGESEQIVAATRGRGVPTWYVLAEDEGHGFRKKKNRVWFYASVTEFLARYLVGGVEAAE